MFAQGDGDKCGKASAEIPHTRGRIHLRRLICRVLARFRLEGREEIVWREVMVVCVGTIDVVDVRTDQPGPVIGSPLLDVKDRPPPFVLALLLDLLKDGIAMERT